jgi:hypothetical protein
MKPNLDYLTNEGLPLVRAVHAGTTCILAAMSQRLSF